MFLGVLYTLSAYNMLIKLKSICYNENSLHYIFTFCLLIIRNHDIIINDDYSIHFIFEKQS